MENDEMMELGDIFIIRQKKAIPKLMYFFELFFKTVQNKIHYWSTWTYFYASTQNLPFRETSPK